MSNTLLDFFNKRSNFLKSAISFTQTNENEKIVASFNFIVSNSIADEENTIKISSIHDLEVSASAYYADTDTNFNNKITYSPDLDKDKPMYVYLILP